jgi:hypothetical protein
MSLDLTSYPAIQSNLFIRLTVYDDVGVDEVITLSDYHRAITIAGVEYTGLGQLLTVSDSQTDIRVSPFELSVSLSGIPTANINLVLNSRIKGSSIEIRRAVFNPTTGVLLAIAGNPAGRFFGIVNNYNISEEYPEVGKDSTSTVTLICNSNISVLQSKLAGRATNPRVQKTLYPGDLSMDRVPSIANANFNFGAPR